MHFDLEVRQRDAARVVALHGELDVYWAPKLRDQLNELVGSATPLIVDLSELSFIDSSGLAVLVAINKKTPLLRLVQGSERIKKVFEITGLLHILKFYNSCEEALQANVF